ncbi:FkbM family methyltransferase [Salinibacter ruber]|uniref:FkbM family methyltransferase n=1 Tax=Salinibacter ruber TaxID=146919 RepID=UPI001621EC5C|nr:FkbM family methyltransferase [Salinibacter ruber]MBB4062393.1 FkbM family methyltransferase [Salinibacter ruber]
MTINSIKKSVRNLLFRLKYGNKKTHKIEIEGRKVCFSVDDEISKHWFYPRYGDSMHEPGTTKVFSRIARESDVIIDVGSHIGWFSCIAGVVSDGEVHAFEMNKKYYERCVINSEINKLENVHINNVAVTNSRRVVNFDKNHPSLVGKEKNEEVKTTTIDRYMEEKGIESDLIKIDVEGKEFDVLRGAKKEIKKSRPKMIIEIHPKYLERAKENMGSLFYILPKSYKLYEIKEFGKYKNKVRKIKQQCFHPKENTSILAKPKE